MPELPEVETVKSGLINFLDLPETIIGMQKSSKRLRFPYPTMLKSSLIGKVIHRIERRAKYLIFDMGEYVLLSHLGMTGNWRGTEPFRSEQHDHFSLKLRSGKVLIYNDARRFGYLDLLKKSEFYESRWIQHLGPEPIGPKGLLAEDLFCATRKKQTSIKALIMNQENVVGVGNIYASESLFFAGVRPKKRAKRLTRLEARKLTESMAEVIQSAIEQGGTTIRDFKNAGGSSGYFQTQLAVYGRAGQPCHKCAEPIQTEVVAGRATYWCRICQK